MNPVARAAAKPALARHQSAGSGPAQRCEQFGFALCADA